MDFVTPDQYTKSNLAHYEINRRAASELRRLVGSGLGPQDRLLDFGCGTGESTVALAEGDLGDLGAPGQVVGVDISQEMVRHCRATHLTPASLSFLQLEVNNADSFISSNLSGFSCITSFSCLHWVQDMPATISLFNKVLKVGGKFLFVMPTGETLGPRIVYEEMKREERWRELLEKTSWMSTVDEKTGYGNIDKEDFVKLMESLGFRVDEAKTVSLNYKLHKDFVKGFVQENIMNDFPEIEGEDREEFFREYTTRRKQLNKIDSDGYIDSSPGGIQIMGEKVRDI